MAETPPTVASVLAELTDQITALRARLDALESRTPLEPMYTIDEAAFLIPCSRRQLVVRLTRHKAVLATAYYRITGQRQRQRLIPADDVRRLRGLILRRRRGAGSVQANAYATAA